MRTLTQIPTAHSILQCRQSLPEGVKLRALPTHADHRGTFTETFRAEWGLGEEPVQWNLVWSEPNVLRGVHVHRHHADYLTVGAGELVFALHDARSRSRTHSESLVFRMRADDRHLLVIPPGVAHAFYAERSSCHLYGVTRYFDGSDEFSCHWRDPALCLDWPCDAPLLSDRDRIAGTYAEMISAVGL